MAARRQPGTLVQWNDDRGFGFVEPDEGGQRAFLHVSQFAERHGRRPAAGDRVDYQLEHTFEGRWNAVNVTWRDGRSTPKVRGGRIVLGGLIAAAWSAAVALGILSLVLPWWFAAIEFALSILTYAVYASDKSAAIRGQRRTPERILHFLDAIGGWPGGFVAQRVLRHKTKKLSFQVGYWFTVALNIVALVALAVSTRAGH